MPQVVSGPSLQACELGGRGRVVGLRFADAAGNPTTVTSVATTQPSGPVVLTTPSGSAADVPVGPNPRGFCCYVNRSSYSGGPYVAYSHGDRTARGTDQLGVNNGYAFCVANGYECTGATRLTDGGTYHVGYTFDGVSQLQVLVGGVVDGSLTAPFDPSQLSGSVFWVTGEQITGTSSVVTGLVDQSWAGNSWTDNAQGNGPNTAATRNSLPVLTFASGKFLQCNTVSVTSSTGWTVWLTLQWPASSGTNQVILDCQSGRFSVLSLGGNGHIAYQMTGSIVDTGVAVSPGTWVVLRFELNGTTGEFKIVNGGTQVYDATVTPVPLGGTVMLNSIYNGGGFGCNPLVIASAIAAPGVQAKAALCDSYLKSKWSV